jgi:hypothetical protein
MIDIHQINIRISSNLKFLEDSDLNKKNFYHKFYFKIILHKKIIFYYNEYFYHFFIN